MKSTKSLLLAGLLFATTIQGSEQSDASVVNDKDQSEASALIKGKDEAALVALCGLGLLLLCGGALAAGIAEDSAEMDKNSSASKNHAQEELAEVQQG